jgi:hypothetical protein
MRARKRRESADELTRIGFSDHKWGSIRHARGTEVYTLSSPKLCKGKENSSHKKERSTQNIKPEGSFVANGAATGSF